MGKGTQRIQAPRFTQTQRVTFPDMTVTNFLAWQPGTPRGCAAGAITAGTFKNGIGITQITVNPKDQRPHAAGATAQLTIGYVDPASTTCGKGAATIRRPMPDIVGIGHRLFVGSCNHPRGKPFGQANTIVIRFL